MRHIILLLLATTTIYFYSYGQEKPPKKSSGIKLVFESDSAAFNWSKRFLITEGYSIEMADQENGLIKTVEKSMLTINVVIIDSTAIFRGVFRMLNGLTMQQTTMDACFCGIIGDYRKKYFLVMRDMIYSKRQDIDYL